MILTNTKHRTTINNRFMALYEQLQHYQIVCSRGSYITYLNGIFLISIYRGINYFMHPHTFGGILSAFVFKSGLAQLRNTSQLAIICVLTQHKRNALKHALSHGVLETEDDCNSRTDEVYTNAELVIITFLIARLNQYLVPKASLQSSYH